MEVNSSPGLEGIETVTGLDIAGAIIEYIDNQVAFPELDVRQRLSVSAAYGVAEVLVREGSAMVGTTIATSGLRERDIQVLTITRGTRVIPNPGPSRELEAEDRLLCFGKLEEMRDLVPERRRRRSRPRLAPLPTVSTTRTRPRALSSRTRHAGHARFGDPAGEVRRDHVQLSGRPLLAAAGRRWPHGACRAWCAPGAGCIVVRDALDPGIPAPVPGGAPHAQRGGRHGNATAIIGQAAAGLR
jgi:hypothetical protein